MSDPMSDLDADEKYRQIISGSGDYGPHVDAAVKEYVVGMSQAVELLRLRLNDPEFRQHVRRLLGVKDR